MANPYHDEAGRFASRDEMRGAIDRLRDSGDVKAALALSLELADIDYARAKQAESGNAKEFFAEDSRLSTSNEGTSTPSKVPSADRLMSFDQKVGALKRKDLSPEERGQIIESLSFGERYDVLEQNALPSEVAEALLEGQESAALGRLQYNDLVWAAIPSLHRDKLAKHASRTASLAHQYWQFHGYLRGNEQFDRQMIKYAHNAGQPGLLTEVAQKSSAPNVLTSLAGERGLTAEALNELASNENLDRRGVGAVIERGRDFIGNWDQTRQRLIGNHRVSYSLRDAMLHHTPAPQRSDEDAVGKMKRLQNAVSTAKRDLDQARERTLRLGMDGRTDTSVEYYAAREDQRDAYGRLLGLQAEHDTLGSNLYDLHDKQAAGRGSAADREYVNQRVKRAENFLMWRGDRQAPRRSSAAPDSEN